jgi:RecA-family ATPase
MDNINAAQLQRESLKQLNQPQNPDKVLMVRSANYWIEEATQQTVPKMLFGKFWHQGEVSILFADSNLGKSILAVQLADAISRGKGRAPFDVEAAAQPVLYCDFEMTGKQFEARYSLDYAAHYYFDPNFLRAELNPDLQLPNGFDAFDDYLIYDLERSIVNNNVKVVIIDNLTYLRNETEQAKDALPLMKQLKSLKNKYDLSILVLAHTPKRDLTQAITRNDLQGSKMLMNFCDSAFTIGECANDNSMRYLKQIKQRNTEQVYGENNICLCQVSKPHNFLQFEFLSFGMEQDQLVKQKATREDPAMAEVVQLKLQGMTLREIGRQLSISHQKADRLLKIHNSK